MIRITADEFDGDWELDPEDLSLLFEAAGWSYATAQWGYGPPSEDSIRRVIADLVNEVNNDPRAHVMVSRGRFLAVRTEGLSKDPEEWAVDLYLNVGCVYPDYYDQEDNVA